MAPVEVVKIRRVVIGFAGTGPAVEGVIATAAEFARLLGVELTGLFIEDALLFDAAALAWLRTIEPRRLVWQALSEADVAESHALAARALERLLLGTAAAFGIAAGFEVVRGDPATTLARRSEPSDLLVIAEPADPIARAMHPSQLLRAMRETSAAVLYVPYGARPRSGAVVALARKVGDSALALAAPVARALNARLIVLAVEAQAEQDVAAAARALMGGDCITLHLDTHTASARRNAITRALAAYRERLLIVSRNVIGDDLAGYLRLASERGVPLLLTPAD